MNIGNCLQFFTIINKFERVILTHVFLDVFSLLGQIYKCGFTGLKILHIERLRATSWFSYRKVT